MNKRNVLSNIVIVMVASDVLHWNTRHVKLTLGEGDVQKWMEISISWLTPPSPLERNILNRYYIKYLQIAQFKSNIFSKLQIGSRPEDIEPGTVKYEMAQSQFNGNFHIFSFCLSCPWPTWGPDERCVPVLHKDDHGEESQEDPQGGNADWQNGKDRVVRHILDLGQLD